MDTRVFRYRSCLESEAQMHNDLKLLLARWGIPDNMQNNILVVVSEAFTNALIHGNKYDSEKFIELSIAVNPEAVTADITDEGTGDLSALHLRKPPELFEESGRGVDLMESIADAIEIKRCGRTGGLQVLMTFERRKYIEAERIT